MNSLVQRTLQQDLATGQVTLTGSDESLVSGVSVLAHGASGDGIADDTQAFSAAAKAAPAENNLTSIERELPRAPMCSVYVPAGHYRLTERVDTGFKDVVWVMDSATVVEGSQYLNGSVHRPGQRHNRQAHGTADYATGYSIRVDSPEVDAIAEVTGVQSLAELTSYPDRDSVGLYVDNTSRPATYETDTATYTATTVTVAAPSHDTLLQYRRGMVIDTKHSDRWSAFVESWNEDGSVITVDAWHKRGPGTAGVPANGTGIVLNGFTKLWAYNGNVHFTSEGHADGACGLELGMINQRGNSGPNLNDAINRAWGMDAATLHSEYKSQAGYMARGNWLYGHVSWDTDIGFMYRGTGAGLVLQGIGGAEAFRIEVSGGGDNILDGGSNGTTIKTVLKPYNDNIVELGLANRRWSQVFAGTGTISTSDEREKQQAKAITDTVLDAWATVDYQQFRFNDAVERKGDGARWHMGVLAQEVKAAFEAQGLDPFAYGVLCHDSWEATPETVDEEGNVTSEARPAGDRYGVRYEEALVLEAALMRRRMDRLERAQL